MTYVLFSISLTELSIFVSVVSDMSDVDIFNNASLNFTLSIKSRTRMEPARIVSIIRDASVLSWLLWQTSRFIRRIHQLEYTFVLSAGCDTRPPDVNKAIVRYYSREHGAQAKYTCATGYKLIGDRYLTCQFKRWSGRQPVCKPGKSAQGKYT